MNEQIEELLLEAHRQTKGGIYSGHHRQMGITTIEGNTMNYELIDKAFLESDLVSCIDYDVLNYKECLNKFAELIVNECLNNMQNCDGDLGFAIFKTKKQFGVEE